MNKLKIAVIFGGTNTEHEVSLVSAQAIISNLNQEKYDITPIKITKENVWQSQKSIKASYTPQLASSLVNAGVTIDSIDDLLEDHPIDLVFPVLHGPYGEDGTIQGLLELMHLPYVGCGVASSAVCMDKILQKNVCLSYNIPTVSFFWLNHDDWKNDHENTLSSLLKKFDNHYPFFVKPANQGSSVGITKAHNLNELKIGINDAFKRDIKIIVESGVENVREIECSILGNTTNPEASVLGEIIPDQEFYSYESKYITGSSKAIIPANLKPELSEKIKNTAKLAFTATDCHGLARVDFLLNNKTGEFYLNEINTMPGFTPISMYPKLWEASGLSYTQLLDRLIDLAIQKHTQKSQLNFSK